MVGKIAARLNEAKGTWMSSFLRYRAIGSAESLMLKAADLGQRWMKGVSREFALKKLREQPVPW